MPQCNFRAMSEQLRPDEFTPHIRPSPCDHCCQNYGAQAKIMGCSTLAKYVQTLHMEAVVTGSSHGPVQSWSSWQTLAAHEMMEEQLQLGPTARSGPRKMSFEEEEEKLCHCRLAQQRAVIAPCKGAFFPP